MSMYNCFRLVLSQVLSDLPDTVYVMPSTFAHVLNLCFHFHPFIKHCTNIPVFPIMAAKQKIAVCLLILLEVLYNKLQWQDKKSLIYTKTIFDVN